jgi:hypothetical protein
MFVLIGALISQSRRRSVGESWSALPKPFGQALVSKERESEEGQSQEKSVYFMI